jgi:uncharacterized protein YicC (UPF0701 family)
MSANDEASEIAMRCYAARGNALLGLRRPVEAVRSFLQAYAMFKQLEEKNDDQIEDMLDDLMRLCALYHSEEAATQAAVGEVLTEEQVAGFKLAMKEYGVNWDEEGKRVGAHLQSCHCCTVAATAGCRCGSHEPQGIASRTNSTET